MGMGRYRKLREIHDAVMDGLCLEYLVCMVCKDVIIDDEDFDVKVRMMGITF